MYTKIQKMKNQQDSFGSKKHDYFKTSINEF